MFKISKKIRILILVCLFVFSAVTTIVVSNVVEKEIGALEFESYKTFVDNDYVDVYIEVNEERLSSFHSTNEDNHMESSTYDFKLHLQKNKSTDENKKYKILNYSASIVVETTSGEFVYSTVEDKGNATGDTSVDSLSSSKEITFNNLLKKQFSKTNSSTEDLEQTPKNVFVLVRFLVSDTLIGSKPVSQEIKYKYEITQCGNIPSATTEKELIFDDGSWIIKDGEMIISNSFITTRSEKETNKSDGVFDDEITLGFSVNQSSVKNTGIKNISYSVFALSENEINDVLEKFDNNILLFNMSGALSNEFSIQRTIKIDSIYDVEKVRIVEIVELDNGSTQTKDYTFSLR